MVISDLDFKIFFRFQRNFVCLSARATMTQYYKTGGLNRRNLLSHGSGGQKPKIKVSIGLVP